MHKPELLLFDLGGVLIESSVFENLQQLLPEKLEPDVLKERWLLSPAVRQFELGEITPEAFAGKFLAEWEIDLSPEVFLEAFSTWPRDFYPQALETLETLRKNHRLACLSNSNCLHWEKFGGFVEIFDITLFSHLLGVIKPDPEAFLLAISTCDVKPSAIYFFDDSSANVSAARDLGIQAFLVEGFHSLQALLKNQGLLPA